MCAWRVDQMSFFKSKDKFSIFQRKHETYLYELVMEEIANNERNKGLWGQAIVKSNGDEKKAEAEYIKLRVESLKDEIEIQKQEETEKQILNEELTKLEEEEKKKQNENDEDKKENDEDKGIQALAIFTTFFAILILILLLANS
jgi:hypothetical protein